MPMTPAQVAEECVSPALLDALARAFPDRLPESLPDPRELDAKIGEQRVIRFLNAALKRAYPSLRGDDPSPKAPHDV